MSCSEDRHCLQIATFGSDVGYIQKGICNFPTHKIILLHYEEEAQLAKEYANHIYETLKIPVSLQDIANNDTIRNVLEHVSNIIKLEKNYFDEILVNITAGDKMLSYAALLAAYINNVKALGADRTNDLILLPIIKLTYVEKVSDAKIRILRSIDRVGGIVKDLETLSKITQFGKPLLSYHIHGADKTEGLLGLGLVDIERYGHGKLKISLNALGTMILCTNRSLQKQINCAACGCLIDECKSSTSAKNCPNCTMVECCCWAIINSQYAKCRNKIHRIEHK